MADLLTGYTYDKDSQRYRNSDTGRFVSRSAVTNLLDQQVNKLESRLDNLYDAYAKGDVLPSVYAERMRTEVRRAHLQQAALAKGGWERLDQSDYGRVGQALKQLYPKIIGTARDIQNGDVSEAQAKQRNTAYAGSGRRIFHATEQKNAKPAEPGKAMVEQRILDSGAQHCEDCLNYAEMGVQPAGTLPVPGEMCRCGDNCRCGIRRWEVSRDEYERITGKESMTKESIGLEATSDELILREGAISLAESSVRSDGTLPIKLIGPGWGSKGYYSADVIKRDGPAAFPRGTQMFWDHATPTEEAERPEGTLSKLAAVLVTDPYWKESGAKGPGLYAEAKAFGQYQSHIDDMGPHIGVSIRSKGRAKPGAAEGSEGRIISSIFSAREAIAAGIIPTVDFVTVAGAGGEIVELFEAAGRGEKPMKINEGLGSAIKRILGSQGKSEDEFCKDCALDETTARGILSGDIDAPTDEQMRHIADYLNVNVGKLQPTKEGRVPTEDNSKMEEQLKEAADMIAKLTEQNERLQKAQVKTEAKERAEDALSESGLPEATRKRLARQLAANVPTSDGVLDESAFDTLTEAAITEAKAEVDAIMSESAKPTITNMGGGGQHFGKKREGEEADARLESAFASLGLSEAASKVAANGRA